MSKINNLKLRNRIVTVNGKALLGTAESDEDYEEEETKDEDTENEEDFPKNKKNKNNRNNDNKYNQNINSYSNSKRPRRNSESDVYYYKILERSKYDKYFKNQNKKKQIEILSKEDEIYNYFDSEIPIRYKILYSSLSISSKSLIIQKIDSFEMMCPSDSEYNKLNKWFKGLSQIPFDNYIKLPVKLSDGDVKIHKFLYDSYEILKKTIHGQNNAKNKIMQILAQWISNPNSNGQIIALEGPPGVGKTSLIKNGVSKALNRPFCFYALGGATDVSNLEGHSYTYEGAIWGRIIEMLMESKVMNPVIFFDELDKISDTAKGNEITGLLTHLTDTTQNNVFNDKYFMGIDIDISKALFFFSFNDAKLINPVLKDRLNIIKFEGYTIEEKINIVQDFIIPEMLKNIGFGHGDITLNIDIIKYIINKYTHNEDGVRNIKRCIEDLFLKINLLKLIKSKNKDKEKDKEKDKDKDKSKNMLDIDYNIENLKFPLNITELIVDNLLSSKNKKHDYTSLNMMYC
jgi:ATP-dependent Lon protease